VSREEVGVEVGFDDELDRQPLLRGGAEELFDVTTGIDRDGAPGMGIADEVRRLR
jgi:hypothetical protein